VNADETLYMVMPRDQNAGRSHITKTDNISFEKGATFQISENNRKVPKFHLGRN